MSRNVERETEGGAGERGCEASQVTAAMMRVYVGFKDNDGRFVGDGKFFYLDFLLGKIL